MPEILIGLAIVFSILIFALVGFINFLSWLFGSTKDPAPKQTVSKPSLSSDVLASRRLIDYLRSENKINEKAYGQLRNYLDKNFPEQFEAPPRRQVDRSPQRQSEIAKSDQAPPAARVPNQTSQSAEPKKSVKPRESSDAAQLTPPTPPFVVAKSVPREVDATRSDRAHKPQEIPIEPVELVTAVVAKPAPWDLPDPPAPTPRRSFGELMSGFMQEKNMRWGELTSGILIVLSAVGLVVSLREELRNTIPYFSALLFMLITAAIHGAGIYTLKKWKLRNTSRGTLIIGLLLIPLNFVAACVLSDRRELNDPWLWAAIAIGLAAFAMMTWWSSKCLLRRGNLPMTLAVMGCGIGTLVLNRLAESATTSLHYLVFALPVAASFLVGTCAFDSRQWVRERWSDRAINRLFLSLGISVFAAAAAISLILVRADSKLLSLVAITPIVSMVCIVTSWIGSIAYRGSINRELMNLGSLSVGDEQREATKGLRFSSLILKILGLVLLGLSLLVSINNPIVFVANAVLATIGLIAMFIHQKDEKLIPIAWGVFAAGTLIALNVGLGTLGFDKWISVDQLIAALFNGKTALCLLMVGVVVGGANRALAGWFPGLQDKPKFVLRGWIAGGVIFLVGCLIALIASLVHRENVFDVMVASGLLILAAIGLLAVCVVTDRKQITRAKELPHFASLLLIGALLHTMLWNPTVVAWIDSLDGAINTGWVAMFAIHGLTLVGLGWFLNRGGDNKSIGTAGSISIGWGSVSAAIVSLGALTLVPAQTGWATFFELSACVCWFLGGMSLNKTNATLKSIASVPFVLATGLFVGVMIAELFSRSAWCPSVMLPEHWLVQLTGLSVWSIVWVSLSRIFGKSRKWGWLNSSTANVDQIVLFGLVFVAICFVGDSLIPGVAQELLSSSTLESSLGLGHVSGWMIAALAAVGVAIMCSLVAAPTAYKAAALIAVWFLAWSYGAGPFGESKSIASALRWLLPIGGLMGAGLIAFRRPLLPAWAAIRNGLGFSGRSYWDKLSTQQLINFALSIVTIVVVLISTVTVSQVLLNGAGALGGPLAGSWFKKIPPEISFGFPVAMIVATFLLYSISEKRSWLATIGSTVFQYMVLLAVVLLFLSPHPKLASSWFINILKAVSLGMTGYGFVWFWMRDRIEGEKRLQAAAGQAGLSVTMRRLPSQIEVHTLINGLLITSLAVLAMGRYFLVPNQSGAWISSVGSLMGVVAWAAFGVLAFCVWRNSATKSYSTGTWVWLFGWMGLILVGLSSAVVDRFFSAPEDFIAWLPFRVVMIGSMAVGLTQAVLIWHCDPARRNGSSGSMSETSNAGFDSNLRRQLALPVLLTGSIALTFAVRGAMLHGASFWLYIGVIVVLSVLVTLIGWLLRDGKLSFVSAAIAVLGASLLVWEDPQGWFNRGRLDWLNTVTIVLSLWALAWTVFYVIRRKSEELPRSFVRLPNVVLFGGAIWMFLASMLQFGSDSWQFATGNTFANPFGIGAFILVVGLAISSIWNERSRFRVFSCYLLSVTLAITLASVSAPSNQWRLIGVVFGIALVVALWGIVWLNRAKIFKAAEAFGKVQTESLELSLRRQLPIYSLIFGGMVLLAALAVIFSFELRVHRYVAASIPFALAIGLGTQSNQSSRRWLQFLTLLLVTFGVLFLAWADLTPAQMSELPMMRVLVRSLIVLAGAMFVYGGLVSRWVRPGDTWLKSLREMAVVTCGLAVLCLILVIASEATAFVDNVGCGLSMGESLIVAILVAGMIVGLITIALRPENDPFALSLEGRMGYVYAAEFVGLALVAHLYFSMPWLFQLGIKDYWPYIMMALCFGGVGVAHVLEQRKLTVLGQPLFNTAAILPLVVAFAMFGIDSQANREIVMMTVGMAYLMISFTHKSLLSGAAAILFGTFALWMFFQRSEFLFVEHPQLWLIPPAISTLIAAQFSGNLLSSKQLSAVRYICVSIIYISSTMEVFISGVGEHLWPPIVLAILSVAGIMSGIMFRIKSFLYFGSLFLLMAMITMVSHAHQRLHHVWPWWAFGIGLGIAILVMFGLFEKRKNEMKSIANQLKDWEA